MRTRMNAVGNEDASYQIQRPLPFDLPDNKQRTWSVGLVALIRTAKADYRPL